MQIGSFDIDGVIFNGHGVPGIYPGPNDVIITGRSIEEAPETIDMLGARGILNKVYFNPLPFVDKTRKTSGEWKALKLRELINRGATVTHHFEDDDVQADIIEAGVPEIKVIRINNPFVPKENRRQDDLIA